MTTFYDSSNWRSIPAGSAACLYADGLYSAVPDRAGAEKRFRAIRWITVLGGADAARYAGAIDFETGNRAYEPGELRAWAEERHAMNCRARVYCDRADAHKAHAQVGDLPNVVWWIATLDGNPWSAASLAWNLEHSWDAPIPAGRLWANQNRGGPKAAWDSSTLYGTW